jgi:PAS domain S-box-containing protein
MDITIKNLKNEKGLLRTLIDVLPDWIYVKDAQAKKILANAADLKNLGANSEAEAVGKDDYAFFPDKMAAAFYMDDMAVLEGGQSIVNRKEKFVGPSGEVRWSLTTKLPLRDRSGSIVGLIGIGRDITQHVQMQKSALMLIDEIGLAMKAGKFETAKDLLPILKQRVEKAGQDDLSANS